MIRFSATLLATLIIAGVNAATADLHIMETVDLHNNIMDFDYYKDIVAEKFGLVRTVNPINDARNEAKNNALVDNGDSIQESPLADYMSAKGLKIGGIHLVYKALNTLSYTIGTPGNHKFNCGLDYLKNALAGAKFPYVNASVIGTRTKQSMLIPYLIRDTEVVNKDGKKQTLKIGYTGVVPPQIMGWDKASSSGKMTVNSITETARKYVPGMRGGGADVVVIPAHSGLSTDSYKVTAENSVYYLNEIPGVNAIMFSHAHVVFPGRDFTDIEGADIVKGTLNGVPAVMPGIWSDRLDVVDSQPSNDSGKWQVTRAKAKARSIYDIANKKSLVAEGSKLVETLKANHDVTHQFVSRPIGKPADNMYSYLALVRDDSIVQVVNNAQEAYVGRYIQGDPDLTKLPVLPAAAPFRVGGRESDPASYVEVEKGQLTFHSVADLCLYPNTLIVVKASGKGVKGWLECSAG